MHTETVDREPVRMGMAERLILLLAAAPGIFRALLWIVFGGAAAEMVVQAMKAEASGWFAKTIWGDEFVPHATKCR
jgi:hypothetical protein